MEQDDIVLTVAEAVQSGSCIPVLGAGMSAAFTDGSGEEHLGMPTGSEVLLALKKRRRYLEAATNLGEAAFLFKQNEGRPALEDYLRRLFAGVNPLPAHRILVGIGFPAFVSFNFDELLERALQEKAIDHLPVIEDVDVPLFRGNTVPVLKPHGTHSRPRTMRICTDETLSFSIGGPLLRSMLTTWLAEKTVLFLGFSLGDVDLIHVIHVLKKWLGEHMPRSYAVVRSATPATVQFWKTQGVVVCVTDLTAFLTSLDMECRKQRLQVSEDLEPWMRHPFFLRLLEIRGLPTETQVIEQLIAEIRRRIEMGRSPESIGSESLEAVDLVLSHRVNYSALRAVRGRLEAIFRSAAAGTGDTWASFLGYEQERRAISARFGQKAQEVIGDARTVLVYSQSQRVIDCLAALSPDVQRQTSLLISECRPKSPTQFCDALGIARLLEKTK